MRILVIADHIQGHLNKSCYQTLDAALQLNAPIDVFVAGHNLSTLEASLKTLPVEHIYRAEGDVHANLIAENIATQLLEIAENYTHILFSNTVIAKSTAPRLAALLGTDQVSEVIRIISEDTFEHPIYVGNVVETIQNTAPIKILTIRVTAFKVNESTGTPTFQDLTPVEAYKGIEFVEDIPDQADGPTLENASIVLCAGRGFKSKEDLQKLTPLAEKLNAALGATRAIVDEGLVPNDWQVGQTGKTIAPELYISFGVSGAIQHTAGIKDSQCIVAINKDPQAPIFQVADYYWVGDLFEAIPVFEKLL